LPRYRAAPTLKAGQESAAPGLADCLGARVLPFRPLLPLSRARGWNWLLTYGAFGAHVWPMQDSLFGHAVEQGLGEVMDLRFFTAHHLKGGMQDVRAQ